MPREQRQCEPTTCAQEPSSCPARPAPRRWVQTPVLAARRSAEDIRGRGRPGLYLEPPGAARQTAVPRTLC